MPSTEAWTCLVDPEEPRTIKFVTEFEVFSWQHTNFRISTSNHFAYWYYYKLIFILKWCFSTTIQPISFFLIFYIYLYAYVGYISKAQMHQFLIDMHCWESTNAVWKKNVLYFYIVNKTYLNIFIFQFEPTTSLTPRFNRIFFI